MKQKKMLVLTFSQLKQIYNQEMPELVKMAVKSPTVEDFKAGMLSVSGYCAGRERDGEGGEGANSTLTPL